METLQLADHDLTPDDLPDVVWPRHEILDGSLVVNAVPISRHQRVVDEIVWGVRALAPAGYVPVAGAGLYREPGPGSPVRYPVPDVSVLPREAANSEIRYHDPRSALLVVEVLSPSTEHVDRGWKLHAYREMGVPAYWIVDRGTLEIEHYLWSAHGLSLPSFRIEL